VLECAEELEEGVGTEVVEFVADFFGGAEEEPEGVLEAVGTEVVVESTDAEDAEEDGAEAGIMPTADSIFHQSHWHFRIAL